MKKKKHVVLGLIGILLAVGAFFAAGCKENVQAASKSHTPDIVVVRKAYYYFVKKGAYKKYTGNKRCQGFGIDDGEKFGGLVDLDKDKIPELILVRNDKNGAPVAYYLFTWRNGKVVFLKELRSSFQGGNLYLEHHAKKKYLYMQENNLVAVLVQLLNVFEEDNNEKMMKELGEILKKLDFRMISTLNKITDTAFTLQEKGRVSTQVVGNDDGITIQVNGREWLRISVTLNGKSISKCDLSNPKFRFKTLSIQFLQDGKADVEYRMEFGNRTAAQVERLLERKSSKELDKLMPSELYSKGRKISENKADKLFDAFGNPDFALNEVTDYHDRYRDVEIVSNKKKNWNKYMGKAPERIKLSYTWIRMRKGQENKIRVKAYPASRSNSCYCKSSNRRIATVYKGKIYALRKGKAVITVTSRLNSKLKKRIRVTVL